MAPDASRSGRWTAFGFGLLALCAVGGYWAHLKTIESRGREAVGAILSCVAGESAVPAAESLEPRFLRAWVESVSDPGLVEGPIWPRRCAAGIDALEQANEEYRQARFTSLIDPVVVGTAQEALEHHGGQPENTAGLIDALAALDDALPAIAPREQPPPRPEPMAAPPHHAELPTVELPFSDYRILTDLDTHLGEEPAVWIGSRIVRRLSDGGAADVLDRLGTVSAREILESVSPRGRDDAGARDLAVDRRQDALSGRLGADLSPNDCSIRVASEGAVVDCTRPAPRRRIDWHSKRECGDGLASLADLMRSFAPRSGSVDVGELRIGVSGEPGRGCQPVQVAFRCEQAGLEGTALLGRPIEWVRATCRTDGCAVRGRHPVGPAYGCLSSPAVGSDGAVTVLRSFGGRGGVLLAQTYRPEENADNSATPVATGVDRLVDIGVITNFPPTFVFLVERSASYEPSQLHVVQANGGAWRALPVELLPDPQWEDVQRELHEELERYR